MDRSKAASVERHLARSRARLAAYVLAWRDRCGLTQREFETVSRFASGRCRISCNQQAKMKRALAGDTWHPQSLMIVGFDEIQELILNWTERGEWPTLLDPNLQERLQPFMRVDGRPMERMDWFGALIGEPGILDSAADPDYLAKLEQLASVLGEQIEIAMTAAGLRPIRDIDTLLSNFPAHDERDFLKQVVLGDAVYTPELLRLALPGIALALRETTGDQSWSVDRLLDLVNGGSAGAKVSPR